jgi:hypothetical protein
MVHWERAGPMRCRIGLESEAERAIGVGLSMDGLDRGGHSVQSASKGPWVRCSTAIGRQA